MKAEHIKHHLTSIEFILEQQGLRLAEDDEAGWFYIYYLDGERKTVWVTELWA